MLGTEPDEVLSYILGERICNTVRSDKLMISIKEVIVVEGMHDKKRLKELVSSPIITTDGFDIFSNKSNQALFKKLAHERGLLILTDSDSAGFKIRNFLKGMIGGADNVKHAYIPDVLGKERRKEKAGKEGKIGVEGIPVGVLEDVIKKVATQSADEPTISKIDLYELGLLGGADSRARRAELCKKLNLPVRISTNSLLDMLNILTSIKELGEILKR